MVRELHVESDYRDLHTNPINWDTVRQPLLDIGDHALCFAVVGLVKAITTIG